RSFDALNNFRGPPLQSVKHQISGKSTWENLQKSQIINQTTKTRCIGLSLETRPDCITKQELIDFRKFGCTKVQIGVQSLNNKILNLNQRGHGIKETKKAFKLLRSFGFKIQAHWMANLYGSNPEKDIIDFKKLFKNLAYKPDELKIYPTALLKTAELMKYYKKGLWQPYTDKQLLNLLVKILPSVPQYCRVTRVIRDFSSQDIVSGSKISNLRQLVENKAKNIQEIRFREIRQEKIQLKDLKLKIINYHTLTSQEKFLQFITLNNKIVAFLRLSLPKIKPFIKELEKSAIIRELHVYGQALNLKDKAKTQHLGLGTQLINKAKKISQKTGYKKLSVISSIGTKQYYRSRGFKDKKLYQHFIID
ncbi:MAG: GNAT family N-acetyltransferase, partial [Patescibacteria group bacterium]|nr:GNAT family N-acetyltransferase [Patescibacteria group bacterium]